MPASASMIVHGRSTTGLLLEMSGTRAERRPFQHSAAVGPAGRAEPIGADPEMRGDICRSWRTEDHADGDAMLTRKLLLAETNQHRNLNQNTTENGGNESQTNGFGLT